MTLYINVRETITVTDRVGSITVTRDSDTSFLTIVNDVIRTLLLPTRYFGLSPPVFSLRYAGPTFVGLF